VFFTLSSSNSHKENILFPFSPHLTIISPHLLLSPKFMNNLYGTHSKIHIKPLHHYNLWTSSFLISWSIFSFIYYIKTSLSPVINFYLHFSLSLCFSSHYDMILTLWNGTLLENLLYISHYSLSLWGI
jgi:hypothetical protein